MKPVLKKIKEIVHPKKAEPKLKVGIYGLTGCAGCQLSVVFNEDDILDVFEIVSITAFPFFKGHNIHDVDIAIVEGLVASNDDLEKLKEIRSKAKKVIVLGACAHTGCIPAYRKWTLKEDYEHLIYKKNKDIQDVDPTPIDAHVEIDYVIPGCPPNGKQILHVLKSVASGKLPVPNLKPVCVECRERGNKCLLLLGKPCMGPITTGGCDSVCTNSGFECWGCRGPSEDPNYEVFVRLLRNKGYEDDFIKTRLKIFSGLKRINIDEAFKQK
ncbi:hypothetical protein HN789_01500 [archaeon]|jgi:sulfhydrogenase subunit delta|nr:hypothetical protein [archaeon]MBT4272819.1 hypothetical protein [archaeon]MBT4461619.1 hypothetical protein [archaeon]MBT4857613.1 hypothetical protein [archaeon]MBT5423060.1 hypothetical protein [archaeon]